jgi:hypothetical protein
MENSGLSHFGMYLDQEVFLLPEDKINLLSSLGNPAAIEEELPIEEEPEYPTLTYEGNFEKGVLVVHLGEQLSQPLTSLLLKILDAVGCSLKDIALIGTTTLETVPIQSIYDMDPNKIIVFGSFRHELMTVKPGDYQIIQHGGVEYLFADDIKLIAEDQQLKRALWNELQVLFNIKNK